ncbi:MAG: nitrate/nitrite transporter NrtS [Gallionella sp.]|nr:nitrate/nitrite transporter NrtS [Gallionella sp.]MDD4946872.1 nitrate/nitrite transporter NrtS [Gallionella sp.]
MTRFFQIAWSRHIVINALKVSVVVGSVLNLVNQGENLLHGGTISWLHLLLNYLVPYCVSSYSAAKNEIELRESNECQFKPPGKH